MTAATLRLLQRWTAGDTELVRTVLGAGRASGALMLAPETDVFTWRGPIVADAALEARVRGATSQLTASQLLALQCVSLAREGPVELVVQALGTGAEADLAALEERGLLESFPVGDALHVRATQALVGDLVAAGLLPLRRRQLGGRLLEAQRALLAGGVGGTEAPVDRRAALSGGDAVRMAHLGRAAGRPVELPTLLHAARVLLARSEPAEAQECAQAAVRGGGGFTAAWLLADALFQQARHTEVERVLAEAFDAGGSDAGEGPARAAALRLRARNLTEGLRDSRGASALLRAAAATDPRIDTRLPDVLAAAAALSTGSMAAAYEQSARLVGDPRASVGVRAEAGPVFLRSAHLTGRGVTGLALYDSVLAPAVREDTGGTTALQLALARAEALLGIGDLAMCDRHASELDNAAAVLATPGITAVAALVRGWLCLARGQPRDGCLNLLRAERLLRDSSDLGALSGCLAALARSCALLGDVEAARLHLVAARASARTNPDRLACEAAAGWVAAAAGDLAVARTIAAQRWAVATDAGLPWVVLQALHDLARLDGMPQVRRALPVHTGVEGPWAAAVHVQVAGLLNDDAERLEEAERCFTALGLAVEAWECAAKALVLHQRSGRTAAIRATTERIAALRQNVRGARTPGTMTSVLADRLTLREGEVVALAARGLRSADVAAQLGVSIRTVESHLYHAYTKLGVGDRAGLASLLAERAPVQ